LYRFFIEELEILLAECRALYPNLHEYEMRLGKMDTLKLYLACLKELMQKFEQFPHKDRKYGQILTFLHSEKHRLYAAGISTDLDLKLDEIF
jgi:hypothetical protein